MSVWCLRLWRGRQSRNIGTCLYELTVFSLWFWNLWGEFGNFWSPAEGFHFARCLPPLHRSSSWNLFQWNFELKERQRLDEPSWTGNFQVFQWSYARWMSSLKEVLVTQPDSQVCWNPGWALLSQMFILLTNPVLETLINPFLSDY